MDIIALKIDADLKMLLQQCELPVSDLADADSLQLFGIRVADRLLGCVGLECYGDAGLLRSLAVDVGSRHKNIGVSLLKYAEERARKCGIRTLYLLTSTASPFFSRYGYQPADRQQAPAAIRNTAQFSGLCPASASFMSRRIADPE